MPPPSSQEFPHPCIAPMGVLCPVTSVAWPCPQSQTQHYHQPPPPPSCGPNPETCTPLYIPGFSPIPDSQTLRLGSPAARPPVIKRLQRPHSTASGPISQPAHRDPSPVPTFRSSRGASTRSRQLRSTVCTAPSALLHSPRISLPRKTGMSGQVGKRFS